MKSNQKINLSEFKSNIFYQFCASNYILIQHKQPMEPEKGKPYMIELLDTQNNHVGKYKFVITAHKVSQLKQNIQEKLIAKKLLSSGDQTIMKDDEDFELGSDDQINDVITNSKVKIFIKKQVSENQIKSEQTQQQQLQQQQPQQQQPQQQQSQLKNVPNNLSVVDTPILDLTKMNHPSALPENLPEQRIFTFICPQIRKSTFQIDSQKIAFLTFYQFSNVLVKQLNLDSSLKALIYTEQGQPLLFNLDLIHTSMPKLDFSKKYYIIFTATKSLSDQPPIQPTSEILDNQVDLKITFNKQQNFSLKLSLENTLSILKYKIFKETGIHPSNQIIKFANNPLLNDAEKLAGFNIKPDSILELHFKIISNLIPATFADKFYYKDVELIHPQEPESYRFLKSYLLAATKHLEELTKNKILSFLRFYTGNQTLVCAFRTLFFGGFLSQAHRIALEEGLYVTLWHYLSGCTPKPTTETKNIFLHFCDFLGFIFTACDSLKASQAQIKKKEETIMIQGACALTTKPIKIPAMIKLDDSTIVVVDRNEMMEQIDKGYTFPLLKKPTKTGLLDSYSLLENFDIFKSNQKDLGNTGVSIVLWLGSGQKDFEFTLPALAQTTKYQSAVITKCANLKIHQPLEVKTKNIHYLILRNKEKQLRIYVGTNKDINKPFNVYDVVSGKEEAVSFDLMVAAGKSQNLQEVVDLKDLKPVITREPKEAIIVLFDISGSMGGRFFNEPDLKRIGACKLFFEALAYRTIAYSFEHVVSLIFFDNQIQVQCDFTEAIYDFNRLISAANPRGSTKLYDTIIKGVDQLLAFKKRYPECLLRIMALTDGEDTASQHQIFDAAKAVVTNDIILDSFAVGASCQGLKLITLATGGKCYLTRNLDETLKLFEQETVLSVRARKLEPLANGKSDEEIRLCLEKARLKPFDLSNDVHQYKMLEIKGPGLSSQDIVKKYQSQEGQKKISGSAALKRIAKQIQIYSENPHPFVAIYPCENINVWKILLLGPKQTPYENGLFLLYVNFPGDYPFKAPQVRFITPIYHCNMNQQGRICHSVFDRNYSPAITFRHIIDCIYGLILTPEPQDPLDNVIASFFLSEYPVYYKNAVQATKKNASKQSVELVEQIFGKIANDIERQKKVEEIDKWIEKAKSFN